MTICRKILHNFHNGNVKQKTITYIWIDTVGIALGTSDGTKPINRSEKILIFFLSIFSMNAGIFCSGMILKEYFSTLTPTILSLKDLNESNLIVFVPLHLYGKFDFDQE